MEGQAVLDIENLNECFISKTHFTKQYLIKFKGARAGSAIIIRENIDILKNPNTNLKKC